MKVADLDVNDEIITQVVHQKKSSKEFCPLTSDKIVAAVLKFWCEESCNDQIVKKTENRL